MSIRPICFRYSGRDGESDGVADRFVETVVGAILEERRLGVVGALVEIVAEFVVDHAEVFFGDLNAHFDAKIVLGIDVPGAGVADHVAISGFGEERALPERFRERSKAEGFEEIFAVFDHALGIGLAVDKNFGEIEALRGFGRVHQIVDVVPFLRPDIAEQMSGNRAVGRHDIFAVFFRELATDISVERKIEWAELFPEAIHFLGELVGRHVVIGPPESADIGIAELASAFIAEFDHAGVTLAHRRTDRVPA